MKGQTPQLETSIVRRLTALVLATLAFFVILLVGIYLPSRSSLQGLKEVNEMNDLFNLTSQISESLAASIDLLSKIPVEAQTVYIEDTFRAAMVQADRGLIQAMELSKDVSEVESRLGAVKQSKDFIVASARTIFSRARGGVERVSASEVERDLLIVKQFQLEAHEMLRNIQLLLKRRSDVSFAEVYRARHRPLIAGLILTVVFFSFVSITGLSVTRSLSKSVENLRGATVAVARGDLTHQAPIVDRDELGEVTFAFNRMVRQLRENQDRKSRLQAMTAAFSEALRPAEVAEVVVSQGLSSLNADAGAVLLLSDDEARLEVLRTDGYDSEVAELWTEFSIHDKLPISEAILKRRPIWIESNNELSRRYSMVREDGLPSFASTAALPLLVEGRTIGGMVLSFRHERVFTEEDREFILSLARLCGQALNRAKLFDLSQEAIRVRDEFLSIASHELKTPITPLRIHIQGLNRMVAQGRIQSVPSETLERTLKSSDQQIQRLIRLVDELLDVARVGAGRLSIEIGQVNLSTLTQEVVRRFANELNAAGCEVKWSLQDNVTGHWDPFRIEQVITNLLTNAIRYGSGKPLEISVSSTEKSALLSIRDHGIGIARKDHDRVFGRFERAAPARNYGGLGLGLYIAHQIVKKHGGDIHLESEPGRGAKFTVILPRRKSKSGDRQRSRATA